MSLAVTGERRRDRSRSRSRHGRDPNNPERSSASELPDARGTTYFHSSDDLDSRYGSNSQRGPSTGGGGLPYPADGGMDAILPGGPSIYRYDELHFTDRLGSPPHDAFSRDADDVAGRTSTTRLPATIPEDDHRARYADPRDSRHSIPRARPDLDLHDSPQYPRSELKSGRDEDARIRTASPPKDANPRSSVSEQQLNFLPQKYSRGHIGRPQDMSDDAYLSGNQTPTGRRERDSRLKHEHDHDALAYGQPPGPSRSQRPASPPTYGSYISGSLVRDRRSARYEGDFGYDENHHGSSRRHAPASTAEDYPSRKSKREPAYRDDPRGSGANILTVEPRSRDRDRSRDRRRDKSTGPATLAPESGRRERDRSRERRKSARDKSPSQPPTARMSSLTISSGMGHSPNLSLSAAPASPLLESYKGTYQDCSPMPSPLLIASNSPMSALSPVGSDAEREGRKRGGGRRARFHDPEDIASRLAMALKGDKRPPDLEPLIEVLPSLTHEQVLELRVQYKHLVKTGADRKGVNVAKHIRSRLKDEDATLMKACYSVALGKWESEAYWANFWYQGDKTRRELLIESLMGRANDEIRHIKDAFTDKKYDNSLTKCMKVELKEDKFKKAVLMVLDERRMDDVDSYGQRIPVDYVVVDQDVSDLRRAVKAEKGGESAMIAIVVRRSDAHLRSVLQEYERQYRANFARDALKKSSNLVGELLAHILNGVINRPVRDALLLHHALTASRRDGLRRELLISRLVRFHWDAAHMQAVKREYRQRYGLDLSAAVREGTSGQWGQFCEELCIARMPDDVRRV